jgi:hypothetical protein
MSTNELPAGVERRGAAGSKAGGCTRFSPPDPVRTLLRVASTYGARSNDRRSGSHSTSFRPSRLVVYELREGGGFVALLHDDANIGSFGASTSSPHFRTDIVVIEADAANLEALRRWDGAGIVWESRKAA